MRCCPGLMRSWRCIVSACVLVLGSCSGAQDDSHPQVADGSGTGGQGSRRAREQRAVWVFYDSSATSGDQVARAIARAGGRVRYQSRWLHAVSAEIAPRTARRLAHVTFVRPVGSMVSATRTLAGSARAGRFATQPRGRISGPRSAGTAACPAPPTRPPPTDSASYGRNFGALSELGVPQGHALGFTGRGVRIAIIDTGFDTDHEALIDSCIIDQRHFKIATAHVLPP